MTNISSELNQKNYNLNSQEYAKLDLDSTLFLAYRDSGYLLEKYLFNGDKNKRYQVLDFGCGTGLSTEKFAQIIRDMGYLADITGIDINLENLENARKKLENVKFIHIDENSLLNDLDKFDLIICNLVLLEHPFVRVQQILNKIQPLLTDGGILITTNPSNKVYNINTKWYSLNNNFEENILSNGNKLQEDQTVKLEINLQKTGVRFQFFDYFHSGKAYKTAYENAGLELLTTHKPLGKETDGINWEDEWHVSPYKIHVLCKKISLELHLRQHLG